MMTVKSVGFDSAKYIELQSQNIGERKAAIGGKLYLEMGGKLFDDNHASRVLPGFTPDNKITMLERIKDAVEIVIVLNSKDLERQRMRKDLGITYEQDVLRLVDVFRERGFLVENIVLTQMADENSLARSFRSRLMRHGFKVSRHRTIKGYPANPDHVVSKDGFGRNEYIETSKDLVVVTAPGSASGKLATILSQLYHDHQRGIASGYAKFETFPVWNLPLDHPVNLAYEAATADLDDVNMIDHYHLAAYGEMTVNYNRDVEVFPLLSRLLQEILGESPYKSPTDMGVNLVGTCISNDEVCRDAAKQEVIRRYYKAAVAEHRDELDPVESERIAIIMGKLGIDTRYRRPVEPALQVAKKTRAPGAAIELADGRIITGKTSELLGCSSAMLLNALKALAGIDDKVQILSPDSITPIQDLKTKHLGSKNPRLHTDEVLIALSVSAGTDEQAQRALAELKNLRGCDVHTTTILGTVDEDIFRNLGVHVTSEPAYQVKKLYRKR